MASRFWVGGTATWDGSTTANWSTSTGGTSGASVPVAGDDVFIDSNSGTGTVTLSSSSVCRSLNTSGFTGTLSHPSSVTVNIGDATAGASNVALSLGSGTTYSPVSGSSSLFNFVSTSTTVQSVLCKAASNMGALTFNGAGGSWQLTGPMQQASGGVITLTQGTLDTNGQTCTWGQFLSSNSNTRTIKLGASSITISSASGWNCATATNLTVTPGTSTITMTGAGSLFTGGSSITYYNLTITGTGTFTLSNASSGPTFNNLTYNPTSGNSNILSVAAGSGGTNITVNGTLTLTGNAAPNRIFVQSSSIGTQRSFSAAAVSITDTDFMDIKGVGAASPFTGTSLGDCQGNAGITFDAAVSQTWSGNTTGNWSTSGNWTSRVPLPQDNVSINGLTNGTITADCANMGKNIDFTGSTGGTLSMGTVANNSFGNWTMASGVAMSGFASPGLTLFGRGSQTITSAGASFQRGLNITAFGGTYTLQDNLVLTGAGNQFNLHLGTLTATTQNVTCNFFDANFAGTRALNMGSGTWTITGTGNIWSIFATGMTLNANTSTIVISDTSSNSKTFVGSGLTYYNLSITGGGTGAVIFTGANTFNTFTINAPKTVTFTHATTTTVTGFVATGSAGNIITINSDSAGNAATLSKSSGVVSCNYLSLQDNTATGGAYWYAGDHSSIVSNVTGWILDLPYRAYRQLVLPNKFVGPMALRNKFRQPVGPSVAAHVGTLYNQSLAGSLNLAGNLSKTTNNPLSGSLNLSGALSKITSIPLSGALALSGSLAKIVNRTLTGTINLSGSLARLVGRTLSGTFNLAGSLSRQIQRTLNGSLNLTGSLAKQVWYVLNGSLNLTGNLSKTIFRSLSGNLNLTGALSSVHQHFVSFAGSLNLSGKLTKQSQKSLSGTVNLAGSLSRVIYRSLAGSLGVAGSLSKTVLKTFTGSFSLSGALSSIYQAAKKTVTNAIFLKQNSDAIDLDQNDDKTSLK